MKRTKQFLALLLTLLMLVTAVPFTAFGALTAEQQTCTHKWNVQDPTARYLKEEANCQHGNIYYYRCGVCSASAGDVEGAESKTFEHGSKNPDKHPSDKLVDFGGEEGAKPVCEAAGTIPGQKCTACNTVVSAPKPVTEKQPHKAAPGKEATCTQMGTCQYCGKQVIAKDPTNHPKDQIIIVDEAEAPTCGKAGKTAKYVCKACNAVVAATTVPATGNHTGGTATCIARAKCTVCGQEYGTVNANKHNLEKHAAKTADCKTGGNAEYYACKDCNQWFEDAAGTKAIADHSKITTAVDPKNHVNLKKFAAKAATCTETGNIEYWFCDGCGKYYKDAAATQLINKSDTETKTVDHTWGNYVYPADYSCAVGGTVSRECTVCKQKETKKVNANEHIELVTEKRVEPTCTEAGKTEKIYCKKCGTVLTNSTELPALGHDYKDAKATGKGDGTHTLECNRCKKAGEPVACTDTDNNCTCDVCKQALAHKFTNYQPDGNATCAQDGTKTAICDVCGKAKDTVPDEGSKSSASHDYVWTDLNDATCIKNGHRKGVCRICEAETTQEIPDSATGHIDSDWKYPAGYDCEAGGVRYRECTVCGQQTAIENIESRPHSEVIDPEVPKTCTTDGKTAGSHCDVCGKVIVQQAIFPAEGHKADENGFVQTKPASCTTNGLESAICGVCGQSFTRTIKASGHVYKDTVVKPTCTKASYTLRTCTVCNEQTKTNIKNAPGHQMVEKITQATTSKNGKVVQTCSVCGATEKFTIYRVKKITLSQTRYVRDSKAHKPSVTITDSKGNILKYKTDYKLKYSAGRKKIGTYTVTITFIGNYKGEKIKKFKIVPYAVKNVKAKAGVKSATLTWDRNAGADVYNIYCATAKDGKYKKVGSTTKLTFTATGLKTGTTYYFKVYAMRKLDTGNYVSDPSAIRKAKIK